MKLGAAFSFVVAVLLLLRFASPFASGSEANSSGGNPSDVPPKQQTEQAGQQLPAYVVAPPVVSAQSYVVMEGACGIVLQGQAQDMRKPPASLTKIMTAILAAERWPDLNAKVRVDIDGGELSFTTGSTVMGLEPGQQMSMLDLLYGLLLPSGNDAALAIAKAVGGDAAGFVKMMNDEAQSLGLKNTHFTNPHGLDDPALYSSAYDLAVMGRELMSKPALAKIVGTISWQPAWSGPPVWNGNALLGNYPNLDGVKIGFTEQAWETMVATAQRNGWRLYVSVMGSSDRYTDVSRLLDWGFQVLAQPDVQAALKAKGCGPK